MRFQARVRFTCHVASCMVVFALRSSIVTCCSGFLYGRRGPIDAVSRLHPKTGVRGLSVAAATVGGVDEFLQIGFRLQDVSDLLWA
jgi:hypothetical protein